MARLVFPSSGDRLVFRVNGGDISAATSANVTVYTDSAGTVLADLQTYPGAVAVSGSVLTTDTFGLLPLFYGPTGDVDTLYVRAAGGPVTAIFAREDDRLDGKLPIDARVVDFARRGADRTGVAAGDALFATIVAEGTAAAPIVIQMPPGTYLFNSPWPVVDPTKVNIEGAGSWHTQVDFRNLTSGPAIRIQKPDGQNRKHRVLTGMMLLGPTDGATTVDGIVYGSSTTFANHCLLAEVDFNGFRDQEVLGSNTYALEHHACTYRAAGRYALNMDTTATANAGEGLRWYDGAIFACTGTAGVYTAGRHTVEFFGTSFDYNIKAAIVASGSAFNASGCHFETDNTTTGTSLIELQIGGTYNPRVLLKSPTFVPVYTSAGSCKTLVRVTGTGGTTNSHPLVDIDGASVLNISDNAGVNALVIDSSTASTATSSSPESHVLVRGVSYQDAGGSHGSYFPFYVQDRAGRKHLIEPGMNYDNVALLPGVRGGWSNPVQHVSETMPRLAAGDKFQPASGDFYVVRLPLLNHDGWQATVYEIGLAIAAAGATTTNAAFALYDAGAESAGAVTTLTRVANVTSVSFSSGPNSIKSGSVTAALGVGNQRTRLYMGFCFVMGTTPEVYGIKHATTSPLLDPANALFGVVAGKLTGQTNCPGSVSVSSLAVSDFVPWMYLRPTTYA